MEICKNKNKILNLLVSISRIKLNLTIRLLKLTLQHLYIFLKTMVFKIKFKRLQDTVFSSNIIICYDSNLL